MWFKVRRWNAPLFAPCVDFPSLLGAQSKSKRVQQVSGGFLEKIDSQMAQSAGGTGYSHKRCSSRELELIKHVVWVDELGKYVMEVSKALDRSHLGWDTTLSRHLTSPFSGAGPKYLHLDVYLWSKSFIKTDARDCKRSSLLQFVGTLNSIFYLNSCVQHTVHPICKWENAVWVKKCGNYIAADPLLHMLLILTWVER